MDGEAKRLTEMRFHTCFLLDFLVYPLLPSRHLGTSSERDAVGSTAPCTPRNCRCCSLYNCLFLPLSSKVSKVNIVLLCCQISVL